jgi:hypothetical protein
MEKVIEKKKVTITEVKEPRHFESKDRNGNPKQRTAYSFKAKGEDGKELLYQTFSDTIDKAARDQKPGLPVEVEYEVKTREWDGNTITDRNVSQMWVDGKPVREDKPHTGTSWQRQDESPEKRHSIEKQAFMEFGPGVAESKIPDDIKEGIWEWGRELYGLKVKPKSAAIALVESKGGKIKDEPIFEETYVPEIKKFSDFVFIMGKEFEWSQSDCKTALGSKVATEKNFQELYAKADQDRKAQ